MTVQIDLTSVVAARCIEMMIEADYSPLPATDEEAIYTYFSIRHRRVRSQPRTVHKAAYTVPSHLVTGEQQLLAKVAAGGDLWPHQSRKIERPMAQDGMLNHDGIQHFHLGTSLKVGTNLIEGTKELLFAIVTDRDFYAIGVYDHDSWTKLAVSDVINNSWPDLTKPYALKAGADTPRQSLRHNYTDSEIKLLRDNQINTPRLLSDGSIQMMMGGGITGDNGSLIARVQANELLSKLRTLQKDLEAKLAEKVESGEIPANAPVRVIWGADPESSITSAASVDFDISEYVEISPL